MANDAAMRILKRAAPKLVAGISLPPLPDVCWGGIKRSRRDFIEMCRVTMDMDAQEFERRFNAFDGERYPNLWMEVHGRKFKIDRA
jgi:hypothetical protein